MACADDKGLWTKDAAWDDLVIVFFDESVFPAAGNDFIQDYLQKKIPTGGPSDAERAKGRTLMWGEAIDADGNSVESRQQGPEGYTLTAIAALNIAEKILAGNFTPGYQTPAKAYGADLVMEIDGVSREDLP